MRFRFELDTENQCYKVRARSKAGQWHWIGTCHLQAKEEVKEAFRLLEPYAKEPLAKALLKALDSIDAARKALKERIPA